MNVWQDMVDNWINSPFESIDTDTISQEAEKYTKIISRCERGLGSSSTAVQHLKNKVFEFKETMPIVNALGNKHLKAEHWSQIQDDVLKVDFAMENKDFTLGTLIDINIANFQDDIIDISI
jgi:dynein heavy chain